MSEKKFINSINYFRGITILLIVMGHMYGLAGFDVKGSTFNKMFANFVTGGTSLFVFISGFMFHYIFYKKFEYKTFMKKKFQNVILPYFIMTTFIIYFRIFLDEKHLEMGESPLNAVLNYYYKGSAMSSYWYIPFVLLLFAISPIYLKFIKLENKKQIILIIIGFIMSGFIHRNNMSPIQSLIYFSPVYMLGIWYSMNWNVINEKMAKKEWIFLIGVIFFTYWQTFIDGHIGTYSKPFFEYRGIDFAFYQKICLIFTMMIFFYRFEERKIKSLKIIADYSFAIFFIHGYFSYFGYKIKDQFAIDSNYGVGMLILTTLLATIFSMVIAYFVKKIFKKHSRKLIGA